MTVITAIVTILVLLHCVVDGFFLRARVASAACTSLSTVPTATTASGASSFRGGIEVATTASQRNAQRARERPLSQSWYRAKQQHLSKKQRRVLQQCWPQYGLDVAFHHRFLRNDILALYPQSLQQPSESTKLCLDIGFGSGDALLERARQSPQDCFLGVEIHKASIATLLEKLAEQQVQNVRVCRIDAADFIRQHCDHLGSDANNAIFDDVCVFFPDPWPNQLRDGDRRIVRDNVITSLTRILRPQATLHIATDVSQYAEHVQRVMSSTSWLLTNSFLYGNSSNANYSTYAADPTFTAQPDSKVRQRRPVSTKYESKALESGSGVVFDLFYSLHTPQ